MQASRCKDCGAAIFWAKTRHNKWMPIEANLKALSGTDPEMLVVLDAGSEYRAGKMSSVYAAQSHLDNCPAHKQKK
jgi:hypothetical protein